MNVGQRSRRSGRLPEYLEPADVRSLIDAAPHEQAKLLILLQWRAGLRVSEALSLKASDLDLSTDHPCLRVLRGKGGRDRLVPLHPELLEILRRAQAPRGHPLDGPLLQGTRTSAWRWVKEAYKRSVGLGKMRPDRRIGTHTLRHSAARHWLANGVPINVVSRWLGHANLGTTLIYLQILPDPMGWINNIP